MKVKTPSDPTQIGQSSNSQPEVNVSVNSIKRTMEAELKTGALPYYNSTPPPSPRAGSSIPNFFGVMQSPTVKRQRITFERKPPGPQTPFALMVPGRSNSDVPSPKPGTSGQLTTGRESPSPFKTPAQYRHIYGRASPKVCLGVKQSIDSSSVLQNEPTSMVSNMLEDDTSTTSETGRHINQFRMYKF